VIAPYERKVYDIVTSYHHRYWSDLAGTWAADKTYWTQIQALIANYNSWAKTHEKTTPISKSAWFVSHALGEDVGLEAVDADGETVKTVKTHLISDLVALFNANPEARTIRPANGRAWPGETVPPTPPPTPTGRRVLLDPGHSEAHPGARGKTPDVQEEDLNRLQAATLKTELEKLGITADIIDPMDDDKLAIGRKAQGYDAFVSLHGNACANKEFYTCCMCHPDVQKPTSRSAKVASHWAKEVASAIGNKCFEGSGNGWPEGVMTVGLSVLRGASETDCPIFFLSEFEFIDDETTSTLPALKERIAKAMSAGAKVLAEELK
jgi:N-acetylmuramoyl-L-alanine amidase